jgi:hypothetical protein
MAPVASLERNEIEILAPNPPIQSPAPVAQAVQAAGRWMSRQERLHRFLRRLQAIATAVLNGACRSRDEVWHNPALQPPSGSLMSFFAGPRFP